MNVCAESAVVLTLLIHILLPTIFFSPFLFDSVVGLPRDRWNGFDTWTADLLDGFVVSSVVLLFQRVDKRRIFHPNRQLKHTHTHSAEEKNRSVESKSSSSF